MTIAQQLEQKGRIAGREEGRIAGLEEGREEGREEGVLLGKLDVARSLLKMGMAREAVLEATGLTEDELAQIRH